MATSSKPTLPGLPELPTLPSGGFKLPSLGALPTIDKPKTLAEMEAERQNPLHANEELYNDSPEQNLMLDVCVVEDEFAAIREARKGQAEAVALANDSEFWFACYFQTRQQCVEFCEALGLSTDKFVDGLELAEKCGIKVTPREHAYKVGKLDKKLADLT